MKRAIVVTGLPASGKTTVARHLVAQLGYPLLDKDDFLEVLYEKQLPETWGARRALSKISDVQFQERASLLDRVVLVSHWRPTCGPQDTGTPTQWLRDHFPSLIEVHCKCSPETATTRFLSRTRHPGHRDQDRKPEDLAASLVQLSNGYPLDIGLLLTIDTETEFDLSDLADRVAVELGRSGV